MQTEIAVLRFGLGARPGDLAAAAADPHAWLMAQIRGAVELAGNTPLARSDQIYAEVQAARDYAQEMKRGAAQAPAATAAASTAAASTAAASATGAQATAAPFNPVRDAYLPHYRAQV